MTGRSEFARSATSPWNEHGRNKKRKKRILQGQEEKGSNSGESGAPRKRTGLDAKRLAKLALQAMRLLKVSMDGLPDPRLNRRRRHLLVDIVVIAMLATICNADGWKDMQIWAEAREEWLRKFLQLPNGIPSRDTLRRTISRLNSQAFQECFFQWLAQMKKDFRGIIAIDGKALRGAKAGDGKPLHIVSAWASEQHLTLGQRRVDGKSNEITAIPELLRMLDLKGSIVTIDAMGCQKAIAKQIVDAKGDYCLAVKENQPNLAEEVRTAFVDAMENNFAHVDQQELRTLEEKKKHGREEERYYCTLPLPDTSTAAQQWEGLKSFGMAITYSDHNQDGDVRFFINSFSSDVSRFAQAVRAHWGIENSLHWVMDVTFREDASRICKDQGGENVSWLRRLAISLIKNETSIKDSIRSKRIRASLNPQYLETILSAVPLDAVNSPNDSVQ